MRPRHRRSKFGYNCEFIELKMEEYLRF